MGQVERVSLGAHRASSVETSPTNCLFSVRELAVMPRGHGIRARTRDMLSKSFRKNGVIALTTYMRTFKIGDYVDIKADSAVQAGMPYKVYHGRTGRVWNVTKRAVGVEVNKQVRRRGRFRLAAIWGASAERTGDTRAWEMVWRRWWRVRIAAPGLAARGERELHRIKKQGLRQAASAWHTPAALHRGAGSVLVACGERTPPAFCVGDRLRIGCGGGWRGPPMAWWAEPSPLSLSSLARMTARALPVSGWSLSPACGRVRVGSDEWDASGRVSRGWMRRDTEPATPSTACELTRCSGLQVNGRIIRKRIHVRIEHVRPSRCREEFLARRESNDAKKAAAKKEGTKVDTKRKPAEPRGAMTLDACVLETITAIPYDIVREGVKM